MKILLSSVLVLLLLVGQPVFAQNFSVSTGTLDTGLASPPGDDILLPGPAPVLLGSLGAGIDVDGFSYGRTGSPGTVFNFSVDMFSFGAAVSAVDFEVTVSGGGLGEQNVDVFKTDVGSTPGTNFQVHDGNGLLPGGLAFPLGLLEPYMPGLGLNFANEPGVDGYDTRPVPGSSIYWSWDAFSTPASLSGADVLISAAAPGFSTAGATYASSLALGLDTFGLATDNIDALEIYDTGLIGTYDTGDVVLFSLDRGSASLGLFGGATPGDVLIATFGGPTGVFVLEATLGLAPGDNLTALSVAVPEPTSSALFAIAALGLIAPRRKRS